MFVFAATETARDEIREYIASVTTSAEAPAGDESSVTVYGRADVRRAAEDAMKAVPCVRGVAVTARRSADACDKEEEEIDELQRIMSKTAPDIAQTAQNLGRELMQLLEDLPEEEDFVVEDFEDLATAAPAEGVGKGAQRAPRNSNPATAAAFHNFYSLAVTSLSEKLGKMAHNSAQFDPGNKDDELFVAFARRRGQRNGHVISGGGTITSNFSAAENTLLQNKVARAVRDIVAARDAAAGPEVIEHDS